jgi:hypothetical protein
MNVQTPTYLYQEAPDLEEVREAPMQKAVNKVFEGVTWAILLLLLAIWAVVGAFFWIPLMFRTLLRFSLSLLQSVMVGRRPERAARALRNAVSFYRRGFVVAVEVVTGEEPDAEAEDPDTGVRLFLELAWAVPVWYLLFFSLGYIQDSPADLWNELVTFPWKPFLASVIDWIRPG